MLILTPPAYTAGTCVRHPGQASHLHLSGVGTEGFEPPTPRPPAGCADQTAPCSVTSGHPLNLPAAICRPGSRTQGFSLASGNQDSNLVCLLPGQVRSPLRDIPLVRPTRPGGTRLGNRLAPGRGRGRSSHNPVPALLLASHRAAGYPPGMRTRRGDRTRLPGWHPEHRRQCLPRPLRAARPSGGSGAASCSGSDAGTRADSSGYLRSAVISRRGADRPLGCLASARDVEKEGFEPSAPRLRAGCSTRLSYIPLRFWGNGTGWRPVPCLPAGRHPCNQ